MTFAVTLGQAGPVSIEVFDLLGFPTVFDMEPTVEAAVTTFSDGPAGPEAG